LTPWKKFHERYGTGVGSVHLLAAIAECLLAPTETVLRNEDMDNWHVAYSGHPAQFGARSLMNGDLCLEHEIDGVSYAVGPIVADQVLYRLTRLNKADDILESRITCACMAATFALELLRGHDEVTFETYNVPLSPGSANITAYRLTTESA
jgi:hypothetical protein